MKNKKLLLIIIGVLVISFIGASVFFAWQGISAANKKQEYFEVYRDIAKKYIASDSEMLNKYGDDISVTFDNSVTYSKSGERGFWDSYIEIFAPRVPDTLEKFTDEIDMIKFNVRIRGDKYEIIFEKNTLGELVVTNLSEINP